VLNYPHIACIPHGMASMNDPARIMWWISEHCNFVDNNDVLYGIGKLNHSDFARLECLCLPLINCTKSTSLRDGALVSQLTNVLGQLLDCLKFIFTSFFTVRLGVCQLQRVYLELTSLLDYEEHYRFGRSSKWIANLNMMGAFTTELAICEHLFQVGIPVWLVRPSSTLHSIHIKALALLTKANEHLPLNPSLCPSYSSIYCRWGDVIDKYFVIAKDVLGYLRYPNPFGDMHAQPLVTPPPPTSGPSRREV
jgi:hypothetical protein